MAREHNVKLGSLNVRGLNDHAKRHAIYTWINRNKFDIVFLQETYTCKEIEDVIKNEWEGNVNFAHGSKHSRGVMILMKPGYDCKIQRVQADCNGRYIMMETNIMGSEFILINVYAPNKDTDKKDFFRELLQRSNEMNITADQQVVCGGDWNSIFSHIDKSGGVNINGNATQEMIQFIDALDLCDIWRLRNPGIKRYTYRQKKPIIQSRLDYFLIADHCQDLVVSSQIIPSVHSDHSGISLLLNFLPEWPKGKGLWKFNSQYLDDEVFTNNMRQKLQEWLTLYNSITDVKMYTRVIYCIS